ncbi:unnamed protein product [Ectocarpus sp. 12 AP-2014]
MLEFLMYELEKILPSDKFTAIISTFKIGDAQSWVNRVRETIGVSRYDNIKRAFVEREEKKRLELSEMNCFAKKRGTSRMRQTIFQISIGAEKNVALDAEGTDELFTGIFSGV